MRSLIASSRVYPRACGGTRQGAGLNPHGVGLSPRLRGNRLMVASPETGSRSIPAPAGEPRLLYACGCVGRVYPRACGGTLAVPGSGQPPLGSYPRRGNLIALKEASLSPVYPRACGGTFNPSGLSPRLRGNPPHLSRLHLRHGSIPAPAGEPLIYLPPRIQQRVYPRACGGTSSGSTNRLPSNGLSPRLRGNLARMVQVQAVFRSIPRACGGTASLARCLSWYTGLSPRLRGNLMPSHSANVGVRSIPAPAGEPSGVAGVPQRMRVYPRACGGTFLDDDRRLPFTGLSPRLRGNLDVAAPAQHQQGSIPAPAGEPKVIMAQPMHTGVYPRACGGTTRW